MNTHEEAKDDKRILSWHGKRNFLQNKTNEIKGNNTLTIWALVFWAGKSTVPMGRSANEGASLNKPGELELQQNKNKKLE